MSHETRNALRALTMSPDTIDALDEIAMMLIEVDPDHEIDLDLDLVD